MLRANSDFRGQTGLAVSSYSDPKGSMMGNDVRVSPEGVFWQSFRRN